MSAVPCHLKKKKKENQMASIWTHFLIVLLTENIFWRTIFLSGANVIALIVYTNPLPPTPSEQRM